MPIELFGFSIGKKEQKNIKAQTFAEAEYEDGALTVASGGVYGTYVDTEGAIKSESELINRYRDMGLQAEVEWAIDDIINPKGFLFLRLKTLFLRLKIGANERYKIIWII